MAIEHLEKNPFVEGDYYPGDLLKNVRGVRRDFWEHFPQLRRKMQLIAENAADKLPSLQLIDEIRQDLAKKLDSFTAKHNKRLERIRRAAAFIRSCVGGPAQARVLSNGLVTPRPPRFSTCV